MTISSLSTGAAQYASNAQPSAPRQQPSSASQAQPEQDSVQLSAAAKAAMSQDVDHDGDGH